MDEHYTNLLKNYPFLTYLTYGGGDYLGIVQNVDEVLTSIYDIGLLKNAAQKAVFMQMGDVWWWESNRLIPINVFLKQDWSQFKFTLKTFNSKDVDIVAGPHVSLKEMAGRRSKRRSITLVRKL